MMICSRHGWVCRSANGGGGLTDCESLLVRSVSAWSIACTSAASPVSLTRKYGFVCVWSALKIDVSYNSGWMSVGGWARRRVIT